MKWTTEEINLGLKLLSEDKSFIDIANILNKTQNCVTKKFNRLGRSLLSLSEDLGITSFDAEIKGSELSRWIQKAIKNEQFIKVG